MAVAQAGGAGSGNGAGSDNESDTESTSGSYSNVTRMSKSRSERHFNAPPSDPSPTPPSGAPMPFQGFDKLRRTLFATDMAALVLGWVGTSLVMWNVADLNRPIAIWVLVMALGIALSQGIMRNRGLYHSWVVPVRAVEAAKVTSSMLMSALGAYLLLSPFGLQRTVTGYEVIAIFLFSSLFVIVGRGLFRNWLTYRRTDGLFAREVLLVGSNDETKELLDVIENNPGLGYRVAGVLGYPGEAAVAGIDVERYLIGSIENAEYHISQRQTQGVIIVESAIAESDRHDTVYRLLQTGVHVQITGGVRGVDQRRVRLHRLADSSIMYLEPSVLGQWQLLFKRGLDIAVAATLLLVTSPLVLLGALAVKLYDRGPILERQDRIDQTGRRYSVRTLRTVVTENKIDELGQQALNRPRSLWTDPYRTPVGRFLEASCINEMPQLYSVLVGHLSLVGHRPTWADDPNAITDASHLLKPGLTGLWRVETSYSENNHRFLDDYYLENWSVALDLVVLLATVDKVLLRLVHGESWRRTERPNSASVLSITSLDQKSADTSFNAS